VIRYGDLFGLRAMQASVKGYNEKMAFPRFYKRVARQVALGHLGKA